MDFGAVGLNSFKIIEEVRTVGKLVKGTSLDGGFPRFFIKFGTIYASGEVADALEGTVFIALGDDVFFNQGLPHTLDARETEANSVFAANDSKIAIRLVDVRTENFDAHMFTLGNLNSEAVGPAHIRGHEGSHKSIGVVSLEVGRPIGD